MKTVIHVNQHVIGGNRMKGTKEPPITVKDYRQNRRTTRAEIVDARGNTVAVVRYEPDAPLPCGAHVWVETTLTVNVREEE